MAAQVTSNPKFEIKYVGNPRSQDEKLASLASPGTLLVAKEHVLAKLLPDALDVESHSPAVGITIGDLHTMMLPGALLDGEAAKNGVHLAVEADRFAHLLHSLDEAGFDWTPIKGPLAQAATAATRRITAAMVLLPEEKRLIKESETMYHGSETNPATESWYDWVTPQMLMASGGGMPALAEFLALVPDAIYDGTPGGREDGNFQAAVEQIAASVGRDISALGYGAQGAAVAAWFKRTRPPDGLASYVEDAMMEVERRAGSTPAERFEPLFVTGWRSAYPMLGKLWPDPVADIVTDTGALASTMGISVAGGLTAQIIKAVTNELADHIAFATSDDNATRTAEVRRAMKLAEQGGDKKEDLSADAKAQLQADHDFQAFKADIEACGLDKHTTTAKRMLEATHAAGILFLNGKLNHDKFWKERAGARTDSAIQSVFNTAVSVSTAKKEMEWGSILPMSTAKKLVAGKLTIHWWEALQPVIAKRNGLTIAGEIDRRLRGQPARTVFGDAEAMRLLEESARTCAALIGFKGSNERSFAAFWRSVTRMAASIEGMPKSCRHAKGLRRRLEEAAEQCMKCPQDRFEAMLATPVTAVRRVTDFIIDGQALNAINHVDDHISRILQEIEDGLHGHPRDSNNFQYALDEDAWAQPEQAKKQKLQGGERDTDSVDWGAAARVAGIAADAEGKRIAFGKNIATFETPPDLTAHCVACFAPGKSAYWRSKWCTRPSECWNAKGDDAHERLPGYPDAACRAIDAGSVTGGINWNEFTNIIAAPSEAANGGARQGRGAGRRGGRGRGGKPGGKGKGGDKGGGKGKGGKGKGKGGKGGADFGRQQQ
jgi:hypothetical protein